MACNVSQTSSSDVIVSSTVEASGSNEKSGSDQEEKPKHRFSEPWEDSDLILVVENEKFHVHRLILSMNSPVFKAMFKTGFQEAAKNEIPLPGKKVNEIHDFLKQFYIQEREEITMENVEHLLKLSDEYQVKPLSDRCIKFLEKQSVGEGNVMKILKLASLYKLGYVRQKCYDLLENMKLQSIKEVTRQHDLDAEGMQNILSQRIKRLEVFLDKLYPQFIGMVECCFWLWHEGKKYMQWCPKHFYNGKASMNIDERLRECTVCKEMLTTLINGTEEYSTYGYRRVYGGNLHFNNRLPNLIEQFSQLIKKSSE